MCRRNTFRASRQACKACGTGVLGSPLIDTRVTIYDGAFHEVDSSPIAFKIAACAAMREGAAKAGIKLLEPIMDAGQR